MQTLERFRAAAERHPGLRDRLEPINGPEDIRLHTWQYNDGPLTGWRGYLNRAAGYAHSANALLGIYRIVRDRGVKFYSGDSGSVTEILYAANPATATATSERMSTGVRTKTGVFHAKLVIVAAGAAAAKLVPEAGQHVVAKSWSVAHVQLTDEETAALRGVPVTYARDLGFFFEPDPKTNLLKLCPMGGGYVNTDTRTGVSHAPDSLGQSNFMPASDQRKVRQLLAHTVPALAGRPLVRQSLCWFADTSDSDFIVDYVPETGSSVLLLSGDSGHGFKMFPIVGNWVRDMLLAPDGQQPVSKFRWKKPAGPESADWGGSVSWRLGETAELRDLERPETSKL